MVASRRMYFHRLFAGLLLGTICSSSAAAQRIAYDSRAGTWTLSSGLVSYRLVRRDQQVAFDYFGPTSRMGPAPDTARPSRHDLTGLVDEQSLEPASLRLLSDSAVSVSPGVEELRLHFVHASLPLRLDLRYAAWGETGVFSREIRLTNRGDRALVITRLPSISWTLPGGNYSLRYLWGSWGQERQLATETLAAGARRFEQIRGRSTNGYVPWLSLRNRTLGVEYLAELAWSANWWIQVERQPGTGAAPLGDQPVRVELGMHNDFGGPLTLGPGDTITLPRAVFTATSGDLDDAANQMHGYQRRYLVPRVKTNEPPLVQFNTWFPLGPKVDISNTIQAADAAAAIGAEVYVLDSGWYTSGDWERTLGDYEPDLHKFPRGLEELAEHVHGKGMKFGLWVEIENAGIESRLFREHPEWCLPYDGKPWITANRCQLDFANPAVRQWATGTVDRLVSRYRLDWIKIDYNIDVGDRFDPARAGQSGRRLYDHLTAYYSWLDAVRAAHPDLVVENCSSGGLRLDLGIMGHTHTAWLSDVVDPMASVALGYGCTVQFAPEICNHWMVGDADSGVVDSTRPPGWWDFMLRVPMNGQFGISGRIPEWSAAVREHAAANVALYKRIRATITGADVYHLTPPPRRNAPAGWTALEYAQPGGKRALVLAYRLARSAEQATLRLRGLLPHTTYAIAVDGHRLATIAGATLSTRGLRLRLPATWRAAVVELAAGS
ncbi:MAG TPA: alpha-galactosidase [Gemmatimonadales bacterium]